MTAVPRVAEFFAGIGLVRKALEAEGFQVVWANDVMPQKAAIYSANFGATDLRVGDVRRVLGETLPSVDLATASFPCTDLSLAGNRAGLGGRESSMFWEFARVLSEMPDCRRPRAVLLENVVGFATSRGGADLFAAIKRLNDLGYICDILVLDARWFVPQSRPRMFIVGSTNRLPDASSWGPSQVRPAWVRAFAEANPRLQLQAVLLPEPPMDQRTLADVVGKLPWNDRRWWPQCRVDSFIASLSPIQLSRLGRMQTLPHSWWATAYRRTRNGKPVWEIRGDAISGCLRTARGGSSKQALVEAGRGKLRVRWMTAVEYALLQGADDYRIANVSDNQALFGFGDAVCVPVIQWIAHHYLRPLLLGQLSGSSHPLQEVRSA